MVGHQLVISLAYYNNNLALTSVLQWKHYLLLRRSYDGAKKFVTQNPGGARARPCTCLRVPMMIIYMIFFAAATMLPDCSLLL